MGNLGDKVMLQVYNKIKQEVEREKLKRAEEMPTEQDALKILNQAFIRLKELGWNDACYCPKDGSMFKIIEAGSSIIQDCFYDGKWPDGFYWVPHEGDLWPSGSILYKKEGETFVDRAKKATDKIKQMQSMSNK